MKNLITTKNVSAIAAVLAVIAINQATAQTQNTIPASGNVGLGTTTPSKKFHIHNTTSMGQMYVSSANPSIFLGDNAALGSATGVGTLSMPTVANTFAFGTAPGDMIMASKTGKVHLITGAGPSTSGYARLTVSGSNSTTPLIGIGITAPSSNLHIVGMMSTGTDAALRIESPQPNPDVTPVLPNNVMLIDGKNIDSKRDLSINTKSGMNVNIGGIPIATTRLFLMGYQGGVTQKSTLILTSDGYNDQMSFDGKRIETKTNLLLNSISKQNVGIGTTSPGAALHIVGAENDGTTATLKLESGDQSMLLDGNEIDGQTSLRLNSESGSNVTICQNSGNVGIGISNPEVKLHISGNENTGTDAVVRIVSPGQHMMLDGNEIDAMDGSLSLNYNSKNNVLLCQNGGNVGIGTSSPNNKLDVVGTIRAEEIIVATGWADYVFDKGYELKSLESVEKFISENGHLPGIPNATEVAKNGVKVGDAESKLLMKIEELTLYLIKQEKRINELEGQLKKN